ncbi:MAG: tetratricopeptide repeat protein, partial [Prevotellaceae bacterium]|nr:tetratricopeptide repeat protein [Prevotellaceae bacterium]
MNKKYFTITVFLWSVVFMTNTLYIRAQSSKNDDPAPVDSVSNTYLKHELIADAKKLSFTGDIANAEKLYLLAIEIDGKCDACYYELANIMVLLGKYDRAKNFAEKAYLLDTSNPWFTLLYARLLFQDKDYTQAQKLFR